MTGRRPGRSRSLQAMSAEQPREDTRADGPSELDGVSGFMGMRWQDPETVA